MKLRDIVLEAALWASTRADVKDPIRCLRSAALVPRAFDPSRHETVDSVIERRHHALVASGQWPRLADAPLRPGRLLVWERDAPVDDGVAEDETKGYLDASAMPPWDTWIAYAEQNAGTGTNPYRASRHDDVSCLLSWVPAPFVESVDSAIAHCASGYPNSHKSFYWLRDSKLPIAESLRIDGLLL